MAEENNNISGFTANETKILMCMVKHLKGEFNTDWEAVATELGYKDSKVLRTRWSQIKNKKLKGMESGDGGETPKKRKAKAIDGTDDAEETPKPKKGGRKTKAQKEAETAAAADADGKKEESGFEEAMKTEDVGDAFED